LSNVTQIKTWRTQLQPIVVDSVEDLVIEEAVEVEVVVIAVAVEDVVAAVDVDAEERKTRNGFL
jgi:hypothetical protein